jgi:hypothetical protein
MVRGLLRLCVVLALSQMKEHGLGLFGRADLHPHGNPLDRQGQSRKASNEAGRAVRWEQGRRREHGQEGTGVGPPARSNRMKSSTPTSVCRRMAHNVPRSSSRCAGTTVCASGLSHLKQVSLLTLLGVPDFTRLATGKPKSGPVLPPGSGGSRGDARRHPFPSP